MNELQTRWKKARGYEPFFVDGAICPESWMGAQYRIAFLLKESYGDWHGIDGPINIYTGKIKNSGGTYVGGSMQLTV